MCLKCATCGSLKIQDTKNLHLGTIAQICRVTSNQLRHVSTIGKQKLIKQQYLLHMPRNMLNFGPLMAEICWRLLGTPANFNGFHVLASFLHRYRSTEINKTLEGVWPSAGWYIIYTVVSNCNLQLYTC